MKKIILGLLTIPLIIINGMHASAGADEIERARKEKEQTRLIMPSSAIRIIFDRRDMSGFIAWITKNPEYIDAYLPADIPGYKPEMESYNAICFLLSEANSWFIKDAKLLFDFVAQAPKKPNLSCFSAKKILDAAILAYVSPATLKAIVTILIEQGMSREDLYKEAQLEIERLAGVSGYNAMHVLLLGWAKVLDWMGVKGLETCGSVLSQSTFPEIKILFQPSNPHLLAIKRAIEDMTESKKQNNEQGFLAKLGRALNDRGKWLELQDETGYTPLLYAAYLGKREAMRYLIITGANINAKTKDGATVNDFGNYANLILEARAVREQLQKHKKGVHEAQIAYFSQRLFNKLAANDDTIDQIIRLAESFPEAINQQDAQGRTPLMVAATAGNQQAVSALLNAHVNTALTDNEGNTALQRAITEGHLDIANLILTKMNKQALQIRNQNGFTAYDLAMRRVESDKDKAEQLKILAETMKAMMQ